MLSFLVINDAPEEFTLDGNTAKSQVQIAKTGVFKDPRYGTFRITSQDFTKWMSNFTQLDRSNGHIGLPVDVDHSPEKKGETEAVGWITSMVVKGGGTELWAEVEWNDLGKELITNKRYAYLSPSFVANYQDETGKAHGTKLLGVGLTNRPFLSMATVSLSKMNLTAEESYTPTEMPNPKYLLDALGLSEDADDAAVLAKLTELNAKPEPQSVKTLAEMAKAEGQFLLTAEQFASLSQSATEGAAAAVTLKEQRFETAFSKALNDPAGARVAPAQKDTYKTLYQASADTTIALLDSLPSIVAAVPVGDNGNGYAGAQTLSANSIDPLETYAQDEQANALHEKTLALCAADPKLEYGDAMHIAANQLGIS